MRIIYLFVLVFCIVVLSCKGKKQTLSDAVTQEDSVIIEELYTAELILDTIIPRPGIRYTESRKVNPSNPPIVIHLEEESEIRGLDLSQFYSQVEYVKLKHPLSEKGIGFLGNSSYQISFENHSISGRGMSSKIFLRDKKIVAGDSFFGYHCFDLQGNYLYTIVAKKYLPDLDVKNNKVSARYGLFSDLFSGFSMLNDNCLIIKVENNKGTFAFHNVNTQKTYLTRPASYGSSFLLSSDTYVEYKYQAAADKQYPIMYSFDIKGDTLCRFMNYNPLVEIGRGAYTNPETTNLYYFNEHLTLRQAYNDTIYRVSVDKLTPAFVLNLGSKKPDIETALKGNKEGKVFIHRIWETDDLLFIVHTENYDCPNNRNNGSVKFFYSYYDKMERKHYSIPGKSYPETFVLKNSIPGAIPLMTNNISVYKDRLYASYTKKQLQDIMDSDNFSLFSSEQQVKMKELHAGLSDYELIIMLLKRNKP